jgi:hypothetical protein
MESDFSSASILVLGMMLNFLVFMFIPALSLWGAAAVYAFRSGSPVETKKPGAPNMRVQRTRSSASPPHSPLTRRPLGGSKSR